MHACKRWLSALALGFLTQLAHAEVDPMDFLPGLDSPPAGRSLFDHLMLSEDGSTIDVPFPIEALVQRITERTGTAPKVVLIPKGRSLQRDHADYKRPRMVFGIDAHSTQSATDLGFNAKNRLFFGYAEDGEQIEVISYNAAAGRYEFQIVGDYKQGGARELKYADRTLCTKCHHNGAPMFSPNPWTETNGVADGDAKVANLILAANGNQAVYHGAQVAVSRQVPYDIDNATESGNFAIPTNRLWTDACGKDEPDSVRCRGLTLRFVIEKFFKPQFSIGSAEHTELLKIWEKYWAANLPGGLLLPNPDLIPYDPIADAGTRTTLSDIDSGLSGAEAERIAAMLRGSDVPREKDPFFQFLGPKAIWKTDSICFYNCLIFNIAGKDGFFTDEDKKKLREVTGRDFTQITKAVDAMITFNDPVLGNRPFRRALVMKSLLKQLGQTVPAGSTEDDFPRMPPPHVAGVALPVDDDTPPLQLVKAYCGACHVNMPPERRSFLKGTDQEITAKIKALGPEIYKRLNWEAPQAPGFQFMPLLSNDPNSPRRRIEKRPQDRQAIMNWVKSL